MQIFNPRTYRDGFRSFLNKWQWTRDRFLQNNLSASIYGTNKPTIEIDCNDSFRAYEDCPHLRAVIDKKAEMFANGEWKCVSIQDESIEYEDDPGLALLNNPNPLQSREDFLFQASYYKSLFGNNFIYKLQGSALVMPKVLWHLPSDEMFIRLKNLKTFYEEHRLEDIIDAFVLELGDTKKEYTVQEIIYKAENFSFSEGKGLSKIPSLKLPINNLMASLRTRNIMIVNFGVKGFISSEGKDVIGPLSIKDEQRALIEKEWEKDSDLYSDKPKVKIVNIPTKFNPMSAPAREMMLNEGEIADFNTICAALGMRKDLFSFDDGATFENQIRAEKGTYESTILQDADSFAGVITMALKPATGRKYILSYDWLPIMQEDALKKAQTETAITDRFITLYDKGLISPEVMAELNDIDFTGDGQQKGLSIGGAADNLGKLPLALQQLSLSRDRIAASTAPDATLIADLDSAIGLLTNQLISQATDSVE